MLIECLAASAARVAYYEPRVPELWVVAKKVRPVHSWTRRFPTGSVVVFTAHTAVDYDRVVTAAPLVFDVRGVTRELRPHVVRL